MKQATLSSSKALATSIKRPNKLPDQPRVYIVSDGSGRTCEHVVQAALVQFQRPNVHVMVKSNVRTARQAAAAAEEAISHDAPIFYTLVNDRTRQAVTRMAAKAAHPAIDLLTPILTALGNLLHAAPQGKPGLYYRSRKEYFDRLEAVEFTLHHDDGLRPHELGKADVVLVGLSRVSKSATCFVLAYNGIRAANVPIVPGYPLPVELSRVDPSHVVGLTMNAERLQRVRAIRMHAMPPEEIESYLDRREIVREVREADLLMAQNGWRSIDVSHRSIEDTAQEVLRLIQTTGGA